MALYDFICTCGKRFEEIIYPTIEDSAKCPKCGKQVKPDFNTSGLGSHVRMGDGSLGRKFHDSRKRNPNPTHVHFDDGAGTVV